MQHYHPPPDQGLDIVYRDDTLLVLDKPGGLLSVPGRGADRQDSLLTRARQRFTDVQCVHRLDMDTSGLMLLALGRPAQRLLSDLFQQRRIVKEYIAVVHGRMREVAGEINLPLICDWPNRPRQKVDHRHGKPSLTTYRVLSYDARSRTTRVVLRPFTGRSHQLRVHMLSHGHAIVGDPLYTPHRRRAGSARLLLHASSLTFRHPHSGHMARLTSHAPF